jgi:hypothetical protein
VLIEIAVPTGSLAALFADGPPAGPAASRLVGIYIRETISALIFRAIDPEAMPMSEFQFEIGQAVRIEEDGIDGLIVSREIENQEARYLIAFTDDQGAEQDKWCSEDMLTKAAE